MKRKRILANVLSFAMIMSMLPTFSLPAAAEETTQKNITLGASVLKCGQQSNVYFGNYQQSSTGSGGYINEPIKWRVLDMAFDYDNDAVEGATDTTTSALLLADKNLDCKSYYSSYTSTSWENSTIRSWLNGTTSSDFYKSAFSANERNVIVETTVVNDDNQKYNSEGGNNTKDRIFLLSIAEVSDTRYFSDNSQRVGLNTDYAQKKGAWTGALETNLGAGRWTLRSPGFNTAYAADVNPLGDIDFFGSTVSEYDNAIRPAFNLDISFVLFTSAAENGKIIKTGLSQVDDYTGNDYKLTFLDDSRNFNVADTTTKSVNKGDSISLTYDNATTGVNEYISAMIVDTNNEIVYYGQLAKASYGNKTINFTIPKDIVSGTYTLKVFNEQINDDYKTDFSSDFVNITLNVMPTITLNANGGNVTPQSIGTVDGKLQSLPEPTRDGYIFDGWFDENGNEISLDKEFTQDTTIYAHWTEKVKVTFNSNGGICNTPYTYVDENNKLSSLPSVTKTNCVFIGWYDGDDNEITIGSEFLESTVAYAKYEAVNDHQIDLIFPCGTKSEKTVILYDYLPRDSAITSMSVTDATTVSKTTPAYTSNYNYAEIAITTINSSKKAKDTLVVKVNTSNYGTIVFNIQVSLVDYEIYSYNSTTNSADILFNKTGNCTVIFADYDDERLAKVETQEITVTETGNVPVSITKGFTLDKGDKIMIWNNLEDIEPLCEVYVIE